MKKILITLAATLLATAAIADTPNRSMGFEEFVQASGCVIRDNAAGQSNLYAVDGGNCPSSVVVAFNGTGTIATPGTDGVLGTADDGWKADN